MTAVQVIIRDVVYILCFILSMQAMQALNYEKLLKEGHVRQAQVLYFLLVMALAWLSGSFVLTFLNF